MNLNRVIIYCMNLDARKVGIKRPNKNTLSQTFRSGTVTVLKVFLANKSHRRHNDIGNNGIYELKKT